MTNNSLKTNLILTASSCLLPLLGLACADAADDSGNENAAVVPMTPPEATMMAAPPPMDTAPAAEVPPVTPPAGGAGMVPPVTPPAGGAAVVPPVTPPAGGAAVVPPVTPPAGGAAVVPPVTPPAGGAAVVPPVTPPAGGAAVVPPVTPPAGGAGGAPAAGGAASMATFTPLCELSLTMAGEQIKKGVACDVAAGDPELCYRTCGPLNVGFKSETCTAAAYVEGGCEFPPAPTGMADYSCFAIPAMIDPAVCGATAPQSGMPCQVAECSPCNLAGMYLDSGGNDKVGYCVCTAGGEWKCASGTAWPCPAGAGCTAL